MLSRFLNRSKRKSPDSVRTRDWRKTQGTDESIKGSKLNINRDFPFDLMFMVQIEFSGVQKPLGLPLVLCARALLLAGSIVLEVKHAAEFPPIHPVCFFHVFRHVIQHTGNFRTRVSEQCASPIRVFPNCCNTTRTQDFCWLFCWHLPIFRLPFSGRRLEINNFQNGSKGRTRTYNPSVNSRLLYH
jgi:hypothetical protein